MNTMTTDVFRLQANRRNAVAVAVAAIIVSPQALAQSEPRTLEPIEVTADREASSDSVVTEERIEKYQADDLEDVFAGQPDVTVGGSIGIAQKVCFFLGF